MNRSFRGLLWLTALLILLFMWTNGVALAHTRVEIDPYVVIVGWLQEPVIVGERNAITIEVTLDDRPISDLEATLDAEILYAGATFRVNLEPTETPGHYIAKIFPTIRGQYSVRLFGTIGETAVDEIIAPEEVQSAARLQFPEPEPDAFSMEAKIDALEAELNRARLLSYGGIAVGLLGTILGALGVRKKSAA